MNRRRIYRPKWEPSLKREIFQRTPFIIYGDTELLLEKIAQREKKPEKSSTTKTSKIHRVSIRYSHTVHLIVTKIKTVITEVLIA